MELPIWLATVLVSGGTLIGAAVASYSKKKAELAAARPDDVSSRLLSQQAHNAVKGVVQSHQAFEASVKRDFDSLRREIDDKIDDKIREEFERRDALEARESNAEQWTENTRNQRLLALEQHVAYIRGKLEEASTNRRR